jgi:hypothetical protein
MMPHSRAVWLARLGPARNRAKTSEIGQICLLSFAVNWGYPSLILRAPVWRSARRWEKESPSALG